MKMSVYEHQCSLFRNHLVFPNVEFISALPDSSRMTLRRGHRFDIVLSRIQASHPFRELDVRPSDLLVMPTPSLIQLPHLRLRPSRNSFL